MKRVHESIPQFDGLYISANDEGDTGVKSQDKTNDSHIVNDYSKLEEEMVILNNEKDDNVNHTWIEIKLAAESEKKL